MSDGTSGSLEKAAREEQEGELVYARVRELQADPIEGNFDIEHLKAIHAYLFQDLPHHQPGIIRADTHDSWIKHRVLEGHSTAYPVHYAHEGIEARMTGILREFGGFGALGNLAPEAVARQMAKLYGDLDYVHGFYEGNSRTLRVFTRELARVAGYTLDWAKAGAGTRERNQLYVARDVEVLVRAFPGLTPERAMQTSDRAEYEASFVLTDLRRAMGEKSLEKIIRDGLSQRMSQ